MADFGDDELFLEFEKERKSQGTFLHLNADESDDRSKSSFIFNFTVDDSSDDSSGDEGANENESTAPSRECCSGTNGIESEAADSGSYDVSGGAYPERTTFQDSFQLKTLKKFSGFIDSTKHIQMEESPAFQIIFQNNSFARKYRPQIENMIIDLLHKESRQQERLPKLNLKRSTPTCVDLNDQLPLELRNNAMWEAHAIIGAAQYYPHYMVDTLGWPLVDNNPSLTPGYPEIHYEQIFYDVLGVEEDTEPSKNKKPKQSCFNCMGDHTLSDCKLPRDFNRINKNRQAFRGNRKEISNVRYHESPAINSKFSSLKPGHIGESLREALGLQSNQLPSYVYRMRWLGYPPGWLAEASDNSSGLVMFDRDGNETNFKGESLESGEIEVEVPEEAPDLNVSKIIEYPGFTVPVPEDMTDEHMLYNMPPLQSHQLKSSLLADAEQKTRSKKRKAKVDEERKIKKLKKKQEDEDMELSDIEGDNSLSKDSFPDPPSSRSGSASPVHSTPAAKLARSRSRDSKSPSLETLQEQYRQLRDQISDIDQSDLPASLESSLGVEAQTSADNSQSQETNDSQNNSAISSQSSDKWQSTGKTSLSSVFSTPVRAETAGAGSSLPDREKFAIGAEEHLLFENLPDSTGTFEKMRGLVKKIREVKEDSKRKST